MKKILILVACCFLFAACDLSVSVTPDSSGAQTGGTGSGTTNGNGDSGTNGSGNTGGETGNAGGQRNVANAILWRSDFRIIKEKRENL